MQSNGHKLQWIEEEICGEIPLSKYSEMSEKKGSHLTENKK